MKIPSKHWALTTSLSMVLLASCHTVPVERANSPEPAKDASTLDGTGTHPTKLPSISPVSSTPEILLTASTSDSVGEVKQVSADLERIEALEQNQETITSDFALTLDAAIAISLSNNPTLITARASEPVARAAQRVAETYPYNPQIQSQILPYSRDRDGNDGTVSQQYVIVQTYELGGQQQYRERVAGANWRQVSATVRQAELMNSAQTTRLFFTALYQQELRDIGKLTAKLNEQLVGVIERRQKAGLSNEADVALTRLQAQTSRRQERLAEAGYQTALRALENQLNLDMSGATRLEGGWVHWLSLDEVIEFTLQSMNSNCFNEVASSSPIDERTIRQLVANRPDVAAARAAAAMARENVGLANAMRHQNVQIGPLYQRDQSATEFWGFQAQFNVPVVNTGIPLVEQNRAILRQQQITAEQLEDQAILDARTALQRYKRAWQLVEQSRGDFGQDISEELKPFEDQFAAGQITLLQVFAARTTIVQSRQSFLDLLNELSQGAADVVQATGLPPQQLIDYTEPLPNLVEEIPPP